MTEYSIWWTIGGFACLIALGLAIVAPGFILGFSLSRKFNQELKAERAEREKYHQSIRNNGGVMSPGIITAARVVKSWGGGKNRSNDSFIMDYEAQVKPEGRDLFRTSFRDELYSHGYTNLGGEMVSEHGRKIWVMYDPTDTSKAFLDHYDEGHEEALLNHRRADFNKLTEGNEYLKKTGEQAEAIIIGVDDLNLPYPLKNGRAMRLHFDVMPRGGSVFRAEANVLIGDVAREKYSVGKTVYIRFDRLNPQRAVLDSERNKSIQ